MKQMLNAAFSFLLDTKLTDNAFKPKATALPPAQTSEDEGGAAQTREEVDNAATTKFASVLAVLAKQAHLIGSGFPNEYLQVGTAQFFFLSFFFSFFLAPRWLCLQPHFSRSLAGDVWSCGWW